MSTSLATVEGVPDGTNQNLRPKHYGPSPDHGFEAYDDKVKTIMGWNLGRVEAYLINKGGYAQETAKCLIKEYRRFMIMTVCFPDRAIPASDAVDEVWHTHILSTRDYHEFSLATKGSYIHHEPTVNEREEVMLKDAYDANTLALYRELFGEPDLSVYGPNAMVCFGPGGNDR